MKKWKYLMIIVVIGIFVFIGIEVFRKENNDKSNNDISTQEITENTQTNQDIEKDIIDNAHLTQKPVVTEENIESNGAKNEDENTKVETLKSGEDLMQRAEKTVTARGWAGASNNVIGLKDGIIYYYNKGTEEFYKLAEGVDDIYYATDEAEEITAKKNSNFKSLKEAPEFLIYE